MRKKYSEESVLPRDVELPAAVSATEVACAETSFAWREWGIR